MNKSLPSRLAFMISYAASELTQIERTIPHSPSSFVQKYIMPARHIIAGAFIMCSICCVLYCNGVRRPPVRNRDDDFQ